MDLINSMSNEEMGDISISNSNIIEPYYYTLDEGYLTHYSTPIIQLQPNHDLWGNEISSESPPLNQFVDYFNPDMHLSWNYPTNNSSSSGNSRNTENTDNNTFNEASNTSFIINEHHHPYLNYYNYNHYHHTNHQHYNEHSINNTYNNNNIVYNPNIYILNKEDKSLSKNKSDIEKGRKGEKKKLLNHSNSPIKKKKEGKFECNFTGCGKKFTRPYNLKAHFRIHTKERPFICEICQFSFSRLHDMKRHSNLHTGIKPFQCPSCDKSFARLDALNRHYKKDLNTCATISRGKKKSL